MRPLKPLDEALADLLAQAQPLPGTDTVTTVSYTHLTLPTTPYV